METPGRCFLPSALLKQNRHPAAVGELLPEQEEWSPSLDQEDTEPPCIKEEEDELWSNREGLEEADIIKFTFNPVSVKSENDEEKNQTLLLHQIKTEEIESESEGEDCGGLEPAVDQDPERISNSDTEDKNKDYSEAETEDCEAFSFNTECQSVEKTKYKRPKTDESSHICSQCGKSFKEKSYLDIHMRIHTGEKPFSCSECGKCFNQRGNLIQHIKIHQNEKPFSCSECGKSFKLKGNLLQHMKIHQNEKPFGCSQCFKTFKQKGALKQHMRIHEGEKAFNCPECGKKFTNKGQVSAHMLVHTEEKLFSCSDCGKGFKRQHDLTRHMLVHTGEKPFTCPECDKGFYQKFHLTTHMLLHTGEKPYCCPECNKKFKQKFHLTKHMIVHTGEKPFSCPECAKSFYHKANLTKHLAHHRGEKPYSCKVCEQRFSWCTQLKRHKCAVGQATVFHQAKKKSKSDKTAADGKDRGGAGPCRSSDRERQSEIEVMIDNFSDLESEDSDDEQWETRGEESSLNSFRNDYISQSAETFDSIQSPCHESNETCNTSELIMINRKREESLFSGPGCMRGGLDQHRVHRGAKQENPDPTLTEEEEEDLWSSGPDTIKFPFTTVSVKSEDDEEKLQISQFHQRQIEQMETVAEQARNSDQERHLQPKTEVKTEELF
ncbi:zinc finger protein 436-like [Cheilinus undulatus]|uniref:zinc finger protein 436-like n=1 Tax=Cheilinus undulatus TaxID=241271 RepID=UPI001BD509EB|nr:zinc finger protein 436-like [Cheilinus undulatus]